MANIVNIGLNTIAFIKKAMSKFGNWKDGFENFLMNYGHEVNGMKHDNTVRNKMVA